MGACTSTNGSIADLGGTQRDNPYAALREAYLTRDAALATSAYTPAAVLTYKSDGGRTTTYRGHDEIQQSFQDFFDGVDSARRLDINFRVVSREARGSTIEEHGVYRLRAGSGFTGYGSFEVIRDEGTGRFRSDTGGPAGRTDFEDAPGPTLLDAEEEDLDPNYYDNLTGRYRRPDGCELVVSSSAFRLFVREECTAEWRGMTRVAGRHWTTGNRVISERVAETYHFAQPDSTGTAPWLTVTVGADTVRATRVTPYHTEPVTFSAADSAILSGTLYLPRHPGTHPAVALVHGSGAQDRRGYASIIAVLADELASQGVVVLTYDKRGVRASGGEGGSFAVLSADAASALKFLRERREVDPERTGLAGSSQAGWVIAKAIESGADPAAVFLLGAAGAALDVREQNLYNTRVRMTCAAIDTQEIDLALEQQDAFFKYVLSRSPASAKTLDDVTRQARRQAILLDWLFPRASEIDLNDASWFTTLELDFDPLPVWKDYRGKATFVFGELDDSTPTELAASRLRAAATRHKIIVLTGAQHLGLRSESICGGELSDLTSFHPDFFKALREMFVMK